MLIKKAMTTTGDCMEVKFTVLGNPVGKGRPRFSRQGKYVRTYTPDKTASYENLIKTEYRRQCHDYMFDSDVALDVRIKAYFEIPQSKPKKAKSAMLFHLLRPMKKPDVDNIVKCVLDAGNGIIYHDDKQVVDLQVRKFYSSNPRMEISIKEAWINEQMR